LRWSFRGFLQTSHHSRHAESAYGCIIWQRMGVFFAQKGHVFLVQGSARIYPRQPFWWIDRASLTASFSLHSGVASVYDASKETRRPTVQA
jgi:hypothetical protein